MKAVSPRLAAGFETPSLVEVPDPRPGPGEILLEVRAAGLNRADLLQLRGAYPPPAGESDVPGLEASGVIVALGPGVSGWRIGQRVMALLAGGGQAEVAAIPAGQLMEVPAGWSDVEAAALPEAALTAWTNLVEEGRLEAGETVLVTGAAGGMGTFALQLARELGAEALAVVKNPDEPGLAESLRSLGARQVLAGRAGLAETVREATAGRGADLVIDFVGGSTFDEHLAALRPGGRLVLLGVLAGGRCELDLGLILRRRLRIVGSTLRSRSRSEKAALIAAFSRFAEDRLRDGRLRPVVDRIVPAEDVAAAYAALAAGGVRGKIILTFP